MKYLHIAVFSSMVLIICGGYIIFISLFSANDIKIKQNNQEIYTSVNQQVVGYTKIPDIFSINQSDENTQLRLYPNILDEYVQEYKQNNDLAAHVSIPKLMDLNIMQSNYDPNFYLTHTYDKSEKKYGAPYVDSRCSIYPQSDNIIVYGHNMNNDDMFSGLMKYTKKSFYDINPTIEFNTIYEKGLYRVYSVFKEDLSQSTEADPHAFYNVIKLSDINSYNSFIKSIDENKLYETEASPRFGDSFVTLVTCTNSNISSDERLVIVAVKE